MVVREAQKQVTREAILSAAAEEFALHGYRGTTFSSIAERMGRPKSALGYHQFRSKLDIASSVVSEQGMRWKALLDQALARPLGVATYFCTLLSAAEDARANPLAAASVRLLLESRTLPELVLPPLGFSWRGFGRDQIEASIANGELPHELDAGATTAQLLNGAFGVFEAENRQLQDADTSAAIIALWTVMLTGLGAADVPAIMRDVRAFGFA